MRTLYFDCFAGISGDMTLGALVAAGADARALKERLALLDLEGYEVGFETVERVHFHEVGAVDAIVDVVGACIGFELLGVERFAASALHVGSGTVEMEHGRFPVPPPAVAELLRGAPVYSTEVKGELVTPTGAAIVATLCESFGPLPVMRVEASGYGAGTREYEKFPNVLRIIIGEAEAAGVGVAGDEELTVVETNVDDVSPQVLGHLMERALASG